MPEADGSSGGFGVVYSSRGSDFCFGSSFFLGVVSSGSCALLRCFVIFLTLFAFYVAVVLYPLSRRFVSRLIEFNEILFSKKKRQE